MKVLGHRGAAGTSPENTLVSFAKGLEHGVDGFEFDVQLSKDGEVVVCHDERVDRTSDGVGWIKNFSLRELKRLNFGVQFGIKAEIPTLDEVLEMLRGKPLLLNVEIKSGLVEYPGIVDQVVESLERFGVISRTIVSSFDHRVLLELHRDHPQVETGVLYECGLLEPWVYARQLGARHLHPQFGYVNHDLINNSHSAGIGINTWTVDHPWAIERIVALSPDMVITNYPERF